MRDTSKSIWYTGQPFEMVVFVNVVLQQNDVTAFLLQRAVRLNVMLITVAHQRGCSNECRSYYMVRPIRVFDIDITKGMI